MITGTTTNGEVMSIVQTPWPLEYQTPRGSVPGAPRSCVAELTPSARPPGNPPESSRFHTDESAPSPHRPPPATHYPPPSPSSWSRSHPSPPAAHGTPPSHPSPPTHTRGRSAPSSPQPSSPPSAPRSPAKPKQTSAPPAAIPHAPSSPPPSADSCTRTHAAPSLHPSKSPHADTARNGSGGAPCRPRRQATWASAAA